MTKENEQWAYSLVYYMNKENGLVDSQIFPKKIYLGLRDLNFSVASIISIITHFKNK